MEAFLGSFASSPSTHLLELSLRLAVGVALVLYAPHMRFPELFRIFGWVVVASTIGLLAVPWRWHHRFARWSVPLATKRLRLLATGSLVIGAFIILSVLFGSRV